MRARHRVSLCHWQMLNSRRIARLNPDTCRSGKSIRIAQQPFECRCAPDLATLTARRAVPLPTGPNCVKRSTSIGRATHGTRVWYVTDNEGPTGIKPGVHHDGEPDREHPRFNQGIPIGIIREQLKREGKSQALGDNPE